MKTRMKPLRLFVPITRVDAEQRLVEGYCYVNAEVGDGVNLTRAAMEEAADYMRWGAVREMHGPNAAGTALGVEFDEKGAFFRAKIVDDMMDPGDFDADVRGGGNNPSANARGVQGDRMKGIWYRDLARVGAAAGGSAERAGGSGGELRVLRPDDVRD